jgi:hypothetical protein
MCEEVVGKSFLGVFWKYSRSLRLKCMKCIRIAMRLPHKTVLCVFYNTVFFTLTSSLDYKTLLLVFPNASIFPRERVY